MVLPVPMAKSGKAAFAHRQPRTQTECWNKYNSPLSACQISVVVADFREKSSNAVQSSLISLAKIRRSLAVLDANSTNQWATENWCFVQRTRAASFIFCHSGFELVCKTCPFFQRHSKFELKLSSLGKLTSHWKQNPINCQSSSDGFKV
jgi:hypothetical protein